MYNLLDNFSFELPTKIEYGSGCLDIISDKLENVNKVLIITDKGIKKAGLLAELTEILEKENKKYKVFDEIEANPKDYNVEKGAKIGEEFNAEVLVALGGGSPIDCAKAIGVLLSHAGDKIKKYEGKEAVKNPIVPLITIPTTAGTGSEITFSSVITDTDNNYKMTVKSPMIAPELAIVDPELTVSLPPAVTAATGLDALTHAIEAYTVKEAEPISNALSLYAVELIYKNIKKAVKEGSDLEARSGMLIGSLMAGIAFSNSDVGSVHCMAESLGGIYDAPHGVCNSILLPYIMDYNLDCCTDKYARLARVMDLNFNNKKEGARKAIKAIEELSAQINLPVLKDLEINPEDFDKLAEMSAENISTESNPRSMDKEDYLKVFKKAYKEKL